MSGASACPRRGVILDVDTGVDDALALLLALRSPVLDLRAVTCVAGNVAVDQVVRNTLQILDVAGAAEVPVARGGGQAPAEPRGVHGRDGMADLGLPEPQSAAVEVDAVELLRRTLERSELPVSLVALGPLTNVATLLERHPDAAARLDRIVLVGGTTADTTSPHEDFNLLHDPAAAHRVATSTVPLTAHFPDAFRRPAISETAVESLATADDRAARTAGRLLRHQLGRSGDGWARLGDAGVLACVAAPGIDVGGVADLCVRTLRTNVRT